MFPEQSKAQSRNHDKALAPTKPLKGSHSLKQPRTADYDFSSEVIFKNLLINKKIFALLALQKPIYATHVTLTWLLASLPQSKPPDTAINVKIHTFIYAAPKAYLPPLRSLTKK